MPTRWVAYDDGVDVSFDSLYRKTTREIRKDKKYFKKRALAGMHRDKLLIWGIDSLINFIII